MMVVKVIIYILIYDLLFNINITCSINSKHNNNNNNNNIVDDYILIGDNNHSSGTSLLGSSPSIALSDIVQPIIIYNSQYGMKEILCDNTECNKNSMYNLDCSSSVMSSSIVIPYASYPLIAYARGTSKLQPQLTLRICQVSDCHIKRDVIIDDNYNTGYALVMSEYNNGLAIVYQDRNLQVIKLAICNDINCEQPNIVTISKLQQSVSYGQLNLDIGPDAYLILTFHNFQQNTRLTMQQFYHCNDIACSTGDLSSITGTSEYASMRILRGVPLIAYIDEDYMGIHLAKCSSFRNCTNPSIEKIIVEKDYTELSYIKMIMTLSNGQLKPLIIVIAQEAIFGISCSTFTSFKCGSPKTTVFETAKEPWLVNTMKVSISIGSDGGPPLFVYNVAQSKRSYLVLIKCKSTNCNYFERIILDDGFSDEQRYEQDVVNGDFVAVTLPILLLITFITIFSIRCRQNDIFNDVYTPFLTTAQVDTKFVLYNRLSIIALILSIVIAVLPWMIYFDGNLGKMWRIGLMLVIVPLICIIVGWLALIQKRPLFYILSIVCLIGSLISTVISSSMIFSLWKGPCVLPGLQAPTAISAIGIVCLTVVLLFLTFQNARLLALEIWIRQQRDERQTSFILTNEKSPLPNTRRRFSFTTKY